MSKSLIIAFREFKERIGSRSFLVWSFLGPLFVLALAYLMFAMGGSSKANWKVLITDPYNITEGKLMPQPDKNITFYFADNYIEHDEFANAKKYQEYDAMIELNENVLQNKLSFVFYRDNPSMRIRTKMRYYTERRLEEVLLDKYTDLPSKEFRRNIKQKLTMQFRDVYDPENESSDLSGWVGFFFGCVIFLFIFLFGMTVLRSVAREKSNRIVEVLLATVKPRQLMFGKIFGIGLAALLQFTVWCIVIGTGLYLMREMLFPDILDASNMDIKALTAEAQQQSYAEQFFAAREYNEFVNLVYERIHFGNVLGFFLMFFIGGYFFYASLFSTIGATMGSESDGQQFIIPLILLLCFSIYGGYYTLYYPHGPLAEMFHYLPFTSPVAVMVKLSTGYPPGESYQIYVSLIILFISAISVLFIGGRIFKNGILQYGHRVKIKHLFIWLKK